MADDKSTTSIDDGGLASQNVTVLDYFAAKALPEAIRSCNTPEYHGEKGGFEWQYTPGLEDDPLVVAQRAYGIAEAMMVVRDGYEPRAKTSSTPLVDDEEHEKALTALRANMLFSVSHEEIAKKLGYTSASTAGAAMQKAQRRLAFEAGIDPFFGISARAWNCLRAEGITTLAKARDFVSSDRPLLGLGRESRDEIIKWLATMPAIYRDHQ